VTEESLRREFMTSTVQSPYSNEQIAAWLRGLLTIAWADGNFDEQEQQLIASITKNELAPKIQCASLEIITPEELTAVLGKSTPAAENFLRTAVMVAIADGTYSPSEDEVLQQFCQALEQPENILEALRHTLEHPEQIIPTIAATGLTKRQINALHPLRDWLTLFGRKIVHIPPMCKINPLYEQLVGLRFRALSYLADKCGEDVSPYI
jgi:tellurite resistance protein